MNTDYAELCSSPEWAQHIAEAVLPAVIGQLTLGDEVLEIGPGYGASTTQLVKTVPSLTAVEVDETLVAELAAAFPEATVVQGSGDDLPFPDDLPRRLAAVGFNHIDVRQVEPGEWFIFSARA